LHKNDNHPSLSWYEKVPLELHGHRKKLDFFSKALKKFSSDRGYGPSDVSILEIGCSNGRNVALPLAEKGYQVTGIDLHEPSIFHAKSQGDVFNANFICIDFFDFKSDKLFDVIVLSDILEHVTDPNRVLALSRQYLRQGGIVLVCIPNGYGPYEIEQRFLRIFGIDRLINFVISKLRLVAGRSSERLSDYNYESGHVQFFHFNDFCKLLFKSGFIINQQANGALFGGGFSYYLGFLFPFIVPTSLRFANLLPAKWVSTWYFSLSNKSTNGEAGCVE